MPSVSTQNIETRAARIFSDRQLAQADRTLLSAAFAQGRIDEASEAIIHKIYAAIAAGKIRVVS